MRIIAFLLLILACLGAAEDPADPAAAKIAEQRAEIEELQLELNKKEVEMRGLREHLQMMTEHMALYQLTHIGIARLHAGEGAVGMKTSELYAVVLERLKGLREDVQHRHDYLAAAGSNGWRTRLWKIALQEIANAMDLNITVSHFPPGTSKWNKIEHRLFSFISQNWRGKPLYDLKTIVNSIAATTTSAGLVVRSSIDKKYYEKGIKVSDEDLAKVRLKRHDFHGEWNYTIRKVSRVKV